MISSIRRLQSTAPHFQLLYFCPSDRFPSFETHLLECAAQAGPIEIERLAHPAALARRARFAAFVSPVLPTVVLLRDNELIAQAVGNLPRYELRILLGRAAAGGALR